VLDESRAGRAQGSTSAHTHGRRGGLGFLSPTDCVQWPFTYRARFATAGPHPQRHLRSARSAARRSRRRAHPARRAARCSSVSVGQGPLKGCLAGEGVRWDTVDLRRSTTFKCTGAAGESLKTATTEPPSSLTRNIRHAIPVRQYERECCSEQRRNSEEGRRSSVSAGRQR
jgi:hypothetical protein